MQIGGIQKFSAVDYPGKLCCIVFCQGCPLRCRYCHNPELQPFKKGSFTDQYLYDFLESRKDLLDAVVFSGGEPLCQSDLKEKANYAKQVGFLVGLHTSGYDPTMLESILEVVDWIGFDIKEVFHHYEKLTLSKISGVNAQKSFELIKNSGKDFEIRTTFDSRYISENDMINISKFLTENEVAEWVIQECVLNRGKLNEQILSLPSKITLAEISKHIKIIIRK